MKRKVNKKEIQEIENEIIEQSRRILFENRVRMAVNPEREYSVK